MQNTRVKYGRKSPRKDWDAPEHSWIRPADRTIPHRSASFAAPGNVSDARPAAESRRVKAARKSVAATEAHRVSLPGQAPTVAPRPVLGPLTVAPGPVPYTPEQRHARMLRASKDGAR